MISWNSSNVSETSYLPGVYLQERSYRRLLLPLFSKLLLDGIYQTSFLNKSDQLRPALDCILASGWLHAQFTNEDGQYIFASQIHRWSAESL
ncbi:hypothetical protein BDW42DRAFT_70930 [Aspergillus taichungensis]|uniref:Uncharacterized protein n=1 Tax=Aspergillus taichungensis TaxID=482145 RepID=A0A2J5HZW9_9EURO|nr:hypothetical protein BDW42DRAFT_70930 [Aspergillus taichungensis]